MTAPSPHWDTRLPPDRFYWAVLDTGSLSRRAGRRETQLGYLFESVLPVPIESVHTVYLRIDDRRVLACGMDRATLRAHAEPGAIALGPAALPEFLAESIGPLPEVASLNLLVGHHEPPGFRRSRRRVMAAACSALLLCALAVGAGQARRAGHLEREREAFERETIAVYGEVLTPSTGAAPPSARLTAELRTLERTRGGSPAANGPAEVAPALAAVLASWPADLRAMTDALSASQTAITLTVRLPDEPAAERLERELRPPPGWRLVQPSVQREREGITVRLRMEREDGA